MQCFQADQSQLGNVARGYISGEVHVLLRHVASTQKYRMDFKVAIQKSWKPQIFFFVFFFLLIAMTKYRSVNSFAVVVKLKRLLQFSQVC